MAHKIKIKVIFKLMTPTKPRKSQTSTVNPSFSTTHAKYAVNAGISRENARTTPASSLPKQGPTSRKSTASPQPFPHHTNRRNSNGNSNGNNPFKTKVTKAIPAVLWN
jgi:hypothetical protein